ncbi:MAG TPA: baseplate J/gp47 family protein [Xanthobacteraceae bacterium]
MPWSTPALSEVRALVRDAVRGSLPGSEAAVPNSVLRVLSDTQGALCHLTLQYVDWLALQLLPDTAETIWLDRHGNIWLVNADGTVGRKQATLASGTVEATGVQGTVVPAFSELGLGPGGATYETTEQAEIGNGPTSLPVRAVTPGTIGNLDPDIATMSFTSAIPGVDQAVTVITMDGGTDIETDDELRARVLNRIRRPPMGGAAQDFVQWALAVPGVTRAWCSPLEMGIGTVSVRFMMDDLRVDNDGFPLPADCTTVANYIDTVRPVAVKDFFVVAPIQQPIDFNIANLVPDTPSIRAGIQTSIENMLFVYAAPGQTIFAAWKSAAIMAAPGVVSFDLLNDEDDLMPDAGHMAVLNDIYFTTSVTTSAVKRLPPPTRG